MSDPIRKPDEFPSRSESILSDTIGLEGYSIETPPRSRIEKLLIELKEIIGQGGGSSTAYATSLEITMDEYFVMSATLKNKDGDTLGQVQTVDLPLESVVVNGSYDSINKNVVLTLENGNTVSFSVADLVSGLQTEITSNNKLDADLVDDTNSTHKFTTASDISKLAGIENQANKTVVDSSITDGGTNPVTGGSIYTALAGKLGTDTHYAGSSTTGGSATSAAKLDNNTDAGSATQPVYFSSGVPTATTYSLAKSVPADAVFTDTTYESKAAASGGTDVSLVTTGDKYIWNNKQNTIDANSKLSADLVDDTNSTHKFATVEQLSQITTNKNNISTDEAAIMELVDNGAKNLFNPSDYAVLNSVNGVTITPNGDGTYTLSGAASESTADFLYTTQSVYTKMYGLKAGGTYTIVSGDDKVLIRVDASTNPSYGWNKNLVTNVENKASFTIPDNIVGLWIRIRVPVASGNVDNVIVTPMICTKAAWDISHAYQPYRPSYQELYEMVKALQVNH